MRGGVSCLLVRAGPPDRFALRSRPPVALLDRALVRLLPAVPRPVVRRLSSRYIAGPTIDDAIRVVRKLNAKGKLATVDVLGEEITSPDEARAIAGQYHDVLARIDAEGLDSNISVKLTGLGLELDLDLCRENLEAVVADAAARGNFVRIDMEDSSTTDRTLRALPRAARARARRTSVSSLQAYLRRTLDDVDGLDNVRLCKGIYVEPAEIAYREFEAVRANYVRVPRAARRAGHLRRDRDARRVSDRARRCASSATLPRDRYEFQMLLGVRPDRADELVADGHRLRVYVPYGTQWYEYSMRRLQENPKIAGYIAADTVGRVLKRLDRGRRRSAGAGACDLLFLDDRAAGAADGADERGRRGRRRRRPSCGACSPGRSSTRAASRAPGRRGRPRRGSSRPCSGRPTRGSSGGRRGPG